MIETQYDLEVNATRHCTNRCASCNHASAFVAKYFMEPEVLKRDLDKIKDMLRVKLFFVQGGEPLLHPKVLDLLRLITASGMSTQCGILTNGKLLPSMGEEFWETLGELKSQLRISVYPDLNPDVVPMAQERADRHGFTPWPRTVNAFTPAFQANDGSNYHGCIWNRCLTLHEGHFYLCPQSAFYPKQFMNLPETIDGLCLSNVTEDSLRLFLNRSEPLDSCRICSGARGEEIPWHNSKNEEEWERASGLKNNNEQQ